MKKPSVLEACTTLSPPVISTRNSSNLTAILLVIGVMDVRAMAVVTAAITAERLAPASGRIARTIGAAVVVAGFILITRALG